MPYIFSVACEASEKGLPVMRAMFLEFPDDPGYDYLDRQYMLGDSLLVAPVFSPEGDVDYYLPPGKWVSFFTSAVVDGGRWVHEQHGYMSLPLLVRGNSIIAMGQEDSVPDYDYADDVTFHVFELDDNHAAVAEVHGPSGDLEMSLELTRQG